jgi:LysR family glycine cleavage system transcriptional activator
MGSWPLIGESDDDNRRWRRWFAHYGGVLPKRYVASFTDAELLHKAAAEGHRHRARPADPGQSR